MTEPNQWENLPAKCTGDCDIVNACTIAWCRKCKWFDDHLVTDDEYTFKNENEQSDDDSY